MIYKHLNINFIIIYWLIHYKKSKTKTIGLYTSFPFLLVSSAAPTVPSPNPETGLQFSPKPVLAPENQELHFLFLNFFSFSFKNHCQWTLTPRYVAIRPHPDICACLPRAPSSLLKFCTHLHALTRRFFTTFTLHFLFPFMTKIP